MAVGLLKFYLRKAILFRRNCLLLLAILLVFGVLIVRITNELTSVERSLARVKDTPPRPSKVSIPAPCVRSAACWWSPVASEPCTTFRGRSRTPVRWASKWK